MTLPRNPRRDAQRLLPVGHDARVLEPSPPADLDPQWYADDPTDPTATGATIVTPIPEEGVTWASMASQNADIARYAADHWLDGRRPLEPLPAGFDNGRRALHEVAFFVVAPARFAATGKLGLRYTHRGFGTPFFRDTHGIDTQIRVHGNEIIVQSGDAAVAHPIPTLSDATATLGIPYRDVWFEDFHDPLPPADPHIPLNIDATVTDAIGAWFGFASHVLERTRRTPGAVDVSRVQLWPEHFDLAFEMGDSSGEARASYGASPGDTTHPEPYLYVAAWGSIDRSDPFWNDTTFNGASLGYRRLLDADDPYAAALAFFQTGYERLHP